MNCQKEHSYLVYRASIKSINCVSIVIILSQQNVFEFKTTLKRLFDDIIGTSLNLNVIHYNKKKEHAPMINWSKFHQVWIKLKKVTEGGGRWNLPPRPPPPPLTERPQKSLDWIGLRFQNF